MSTLESCTDVLLQQKVVQSSNYERLESRLMEMERTKRLLFFGLKEAITDVERRRQDLNELQQENARLQQMLQRDHVRFDALAVYMRDERKKAVHLQEIMENCTTTWTGCPSRVALLARALQERQVFCTQMEGILIALKRIQELVTVVRLTEAVGVLLNTRLGEHGGEITRLEESVRCECQQLHTRMLHLKQCCSEAGERNAQLWCEAQSLDVLLFSSSIDVSAARLRSSEAEGRSAVMRSALQDALGVGDAHNARKERVMLASKFAMWHCSLFGCVKTVVMERWEAAEGAATAQECALLKRHQRLSEERDQAVQKCGDSKELSALMCLTADGLERRLSSLGILLAALYDFHGRQQTRANDVSCKKASLLTAVSAARSAHEARVIEQRLLLLQSEAREGLCAEESLTRSLFVDGEDNTRKVLITHLKQEVRTLNEQLRQKQMRNAAAMDKADVLDTAVRPVLSERNSTRSSRTKALTEKKRPRGRTETLYVNAPERQTYPQSRHVQKERRESEQAEDDIKSSTHPGAALQERAIIGMRLPLQAVKSSRGAAPIGSVVPDKPYQREGINASSGRKEPARRDPTISVSQHPSVVASPPPKPPSALSVMSKKFSERNTAHSPIQHRPRPTPATSKDLWGSGKHEDIFADVFSF
ncbi:hypothetical protein ERJ75_001005400 [Trypanosoma vivax]|uniref:Uncharacterized protein n=1 Tax=Trypanosoma vivax (strain Y486) TaxID=1055687 RepID=G0TYH5_TRYVY|nr:hypothetical protein TRVL_07782 [Trypanosoma vivax]KAH8612020.1 hypothetical protein ERJ75_001005400 [Trypanosoma vivax]CCC49022.1 conserved hypothetical protein [Trypanosoma vivax Y486]